MSITVRLWTKEDLKQAGKDKWTATILMNCSTFSIDMILALKRIPFKQRTFSLYWNPNQDETTVKATDIKMLKRFIEAEYTGYPNEVIEVITKYKKVKLKDDKKTFQGIS